MLILRFYLMVAISIMSVLGGCTSSDSTKEQKIALAKKLAEDRHAAAMLIINNLARKSGAIVDWKEQLGSTDFAVLNRVYTIDVERVWTVKKPILFIGILDDVAPEDQKNYQLFIRDYGLFFPETRLYLSCIKEAVDPLLAAVKKDKESIYAGGIAVIARIDKVEHQMSFDDKGTKHIFVGHGQCVDLVHIGDALSSY